MIKRLSLPLSRLKISAKVYLAFGGILSFYLAGLMLLFYSIHEVDAQLEQIIHIHAPLRAAAFELEINTVGVGMGVMKYLERPDPRHRQRVEKDGADFRRFKNEYDSLVRSDDGRRLGREIESLYGSFVTLGAALMAQQDELESALAHFGDVTRKADGLLDKQLMGGNSGPRVITLEARIAEMGQWLALYLHTRNKVYLDLLEQDRAEVRRLLAAWSGDAGWHQDVRRLVDQGLLQVDLIIRLQQRRDADIQRFIDLRRQLDHLLDESLQKLVERSAMDAKRHVEATVHRVFATVAGITLLLLVISIIAARFLVRVVIQPMRKLSGGVAALAGGKLDHRIEHTSRDEFGELAQGFNQMASQLLENRVGLELRVEERTQELAYQATHDALTGLANRAGFAQRLNDALKSARRRGEKLGVLLLDLDGFKDINDSRGHDVGDRLLQEVGRRLQGHVRDVDLAARLGGDEFCLLLENVEGHMQAAEVAERCLDALSAPIPLGGAELGARGSIGIAVYPDDGEEPNVLLKAADTAMYAAKRPGGHRYAFYEARMTQEVERRMVMESALRVAVNRGEFELHYQPQVRLENGRMWGTEALIRWRHPERGLVPPDEFIPLAEHLGLIDVLGEWVLRTACRQAMSWQEEGLEGLVMAVNVSPSHFESPGFVAAVARVLRDTGLAPERLEIEVTESITRNPSLHAAVSADLRGLGVHMAIDDFGTGYSSLTVLKHMPINTLKLDRQFIHDMLGDARSSVLVGSIIAMATGLDLDVVAEGVETLEQVQVLKGLGCPLAQGYFFSRPVTAEAIPALAARDFLRPVSEAQGAGTRIDSANAWG